MFVGTVDSFIFVDSNFSGFRETLLFVGQPKSTYKFLDYNVFFEHLNLWLNYNLEIQVNKNGSTIFKYMVKLLLNFILISLQVWDLRKNDVLYRLRGHADTLTGLTLSPDGSYLLSNSMDNTCRYYNATDRQYGSLDSTKTIVLY